MASVPGHNKLGLLAVRQTTPSTGVFSESLRAIHFATIPRIKRGTRITARNVIPRNRYGRLTIADSRYSLPPRRR